jgi:hypothetical protein
MHYHHVNSMRPATAVCKFFVFCFFFPHGMKSKYECYRFHPVTTLCETFGVAMDCGLHGWGSIPGRGKEFFLIPQRPIRPCGPSSLLTNGYRSLFLRR